MELIEELKRQADMFGPGDPPDEQQLPEEVIDELNDYFAETFPSGEAQTHQGAITAMAVLNGAIIACEALGELEETDG